MEIRKREREGEEVGGVAEAERVQCRGSELRGEAEREIQIRREGQLRRRSVKCSYYIYYIYFYLFIRLLLSNKIKV